MTIAPSCFSYAHPSSECLSGCKEFGLVYKTYDVMQIHDCGNPQCCWNGQETEIGSVTVTNGLSSWISKVFWDGECADCAETGDIPSRIKVVPPVAGQETACGSPY